MILFFNMFDKLYQYYRGILHILRNIYHWKFWLEILIGNFEISFENSNLRNVIMESNKNFSETPRNYAH